MTEQHIQEPWMFREECANSLVIEECKTGDTIADVIGKDDDEWNETDFANARRIVACVNACKGIPTGELEMHGYLTSAPKDVP